MSPGIPSRAQRLTREACYASVKLSPVASTGVTMHTRTQFAALPIMSRSVHVSCPRAHICGGLAP